ncbi:hypothetical protein ACOMHN_002333 [Nucella lapillus]
MEFSASKGKKPVRAPRSGKHSQPSTSGQSASHSETAAGPQPSTSGQSASHSETAAGPQPSTSGQSASHSATATRSRKERQPSAATLPATSSLYPVLARRPQSNEPVLSRVREGHYERKQGRQAEDPATVQQKARLAVLRKGGNPGDRTQLLGQGESFHWLLENTLGWVANLIANMEQAQEKPVGSNISKNKFLLREYCLLFAEGREAVQMKQGAQQASSQCTPLRDPQRNPAPRAPQAAPTPPRAPQAALTPPLTSSTDLSAISEAELVEAVEMAERQLAVGEVTALDFLVGSLVCVFSCQCIGPHFMICVCRSQLQEQGVAEPSDGDIRRSITKQELALHCRRATRGTEETTLLLNSLIDLYTSPMPPTP